RPKSMRRGERTVTEASGRWTGRKFSPYDRASLMTRARGRAGCECRSRSTCSGNGRPGVEPQQRADAVADLVDLDQLEPSVLCDEGTQQEGIGAVLGGVGAAERADFVGRGTQDQRIVA